MKRRSLCGIEPAQMQVGGQTGREAQKAEDDVLDARRAHRTRRARRSRRAPRRPGAARPRRRGRPGSTARSRRRAACRGSAGCRRCSRSLPSSPASASSLSFRTPGWYSSRCPTISTRPARRGRGHRALGVGDRLGQRLLDEAVLAGREHAQRPARRGSGTGVASDDSVERRIGQQLVEVGADPAPREHRRDAGAGRLGRVAAPAQLAAREGGEVASQVRAPVAEAGDADADLGIAHGRPVYELCVAVLAGRSRPGA